MQYSFEQFCVQHRGKINARSGHAIAKGESCPERLITLIHKRTINKHGRETILHALSGIVSQADTEILKLTMDEIQLYESQLTTCKERLLILCNQYYHQELELLTTLPGVKEHSAACIIAEIGVDMKSFLTATALVGWAGLRPRNNESAGKIKSRKTLHGNKYLRSMLVQCAWAASRTKSSKFMRRYTALKKRMNHNKALMANTRKILVVVWHILSKKMSYMANAA